MDVYETNFTLYDWHINSSKSLYSNNRSFLLTSNYIKKKKNNNILDSLSTQPHQSIFPNIFKSLDFSFLFSSSPLYILSNCKTKTKPFATQTLGNVEPVSTQPLVPTATSTLRWIDTGSVEITGGCQVPPEQRDGRGIMNGQMFPNYNTLRLCNVMETSCAN